VARQRAPLSGLRTVRELKDHPALPDLIPALPPRALTRLYDTVGLNDAGSLMALTPIPLLAQALGEAVWVGLGNQTRFDPDVFIDWLEVWVGEGEGFAAERLLALDEDMLALCFSEVVRVEDSSVTGFCREADDAGELLSPGADTALFGRFLVAARLEDEWNVVHGGLLALWSHHPDRLLALLERLTLSDAQPCDASGSRLQQDAAGAREAHQERSGFVPPGAARAFLANAEMMSPHELMGMTDYDLETQRHLTLLHRARQQDAAASPATSAAAIAIAHSSAADAVDDSGDDPAVESPAAASRDPQLRDLLVNAGILEAANPVGALAGPQAGPELVLRQRLDSLAATDPDGLAHAASELAYLANVLLTGVDLPGSERAREDQARELAFATASLGLELLEHRALPVTIGVAPGLIRTFLVAWRTVAELPQHLLRAFERTLASPQTVRSLEDKAWLRGQMEESLNDLRSAVRGARFDAARDAVSVLSLGFDTRTCRAATHLLGQPPRFPGLLEGGDKDASRWIRAVDDLERVSALLQGLGPKV
jgi:hypothetical protein